MLERVSPSAECAAHHILRQIDGPVRSSRRLGSSFWRHGNNDAEIPPWWTLYLESVRDKTTVLSPWSKSFNVAGASLGIQNINHNVLPQANTRTFSHARSQAQLASAEMNTEDEKVSQHYGRFEVKGGFEQEPINNAEYNVEVENIRRAKKAGESTTEARLPTRWRNHLRSAWKSFIESGWDKQRASKLLQDYASSNQKAELRLALRALEYIPRKERTKDDYDAAVNAAVRLDRYSAVIQIVRESVSQGLGRDMFIKSIAVCVSQSLWNTAADIWKEFDPKWNITLRTATADPVDKTRNFAKGFMVHFDNIPDLPSKLAILHDRLTKLDPVLMARKPFLIEIYKNLALLAVESDKVMDIITPEGILNIFSDLLEFDSKTRLHLDALATLRRHPDKGAKSQLAILIYNNLQTLSSTAWLPEWIFGTMLSICSAARQPPRTYRSLLEDYKSIHGYSGDFIYLQVMKVCATQGEVRDVMDIFEEYRTNFKIKDPEQLNPLIRVYAVVGDYHNAQLQFDQIHSKFGLKPNDKNWSTLLLAYSRSEHPELAYSKFQLMKMSGINPSPHAWSVIVAVAAKKGDMRRARDLIQDARDAGITPPIAMSGALIDSYLMNYRPSEAWHMALQATKTSRLTGESPTRLWNSLLRYFAFQSDFEGIALTQERMKDNGVKADSMTYAALMTALVVQGKSKDAVQILRALHSSRQLTANEVHYSILIHGFAMEKNADFATKIYHEMLQYFPRATPSANLSMLFLKGLRAEEKARSDYLSGQKYRTPDFLQLSREVDRTITEINASDRTSSAPNPGFSRRSVRGDLEDAYLGSLITFLQRNNAYESAGKVIELKKQEQQKNAEKLYTATTVTSWRSRLKNTLQEMENLIASRNWSAVSATWDQTIALALENCSLKVKSSGSARSIETGKTQGSNFTTMIPDQSKESWSSIDQGGIIWGHLFVLSRHLSLYIIALERQSKYAEAIAVTKRIRALGFRLSSKNWNTLIQVLCRSPNSDHSMLAYQLFQKFLLPLTPSWDVIRRGKWVNPANEIKGVKQPSETKTDNRIDRKIIEKRSPWVLMPTYYTMVHLAIVWLRASRLSSRGDHTLSRELKIRAPQTVSRVLQTPYLRDRVQGVLLRGRNVIGDRIKRPRELGNKSDISGIQESQLLIDRLSQESLVALQAKILQQEESATSVDPADMDDITGQIQDSAILLPAKGRLETEDQLRKRTRMSKRQRDLVSQTLINQLQQKSRSLPQLVATPERGVPAVGQLDIMPRKERAGASEAHLMTINAATTGEADESGSQNIAISSRSRLDTLSQLPVTLRRDRSRSLSRGPALRARRQKQFIRVDQLNQHQPVLLVTDGLVKLPRRNDRNPMSRHRRRPNKAVGTLTRRRPHPFLLSKLERQLVYNRKMVNTLQARKTSMESPISLTSRRITHHQSRERNIRKRLVAYLDRKQPRKRFMRQSEK